MPELPEVETMVRGIRPAFEGARIVDVVLPLCLRKPILISPQFPTLKIASQGREVVAVKRRAKRIVIELDNFSVFVIEPRMTGLMVIDQPPSQDHLRFEWKLARGRQTHSVWFWDRRGLGTLRLLQQEELEDHLGTHKLGVDALEMSSESWRKKLAHTHRTIKVAMLDQKLVAGIGNLYASEILHRAGIHPETVSSALTQPRIKRLQACVLEVLEEAISYEGSTLGDGTYRNALNQDGSYQNQHRVYGKQGEYCSTCGRGVIQRIVQAQRSTFFCPRCQK